MPSGREVNLFNVQPRKRDYTREVTDESRQIMRRFGQQYFDDPTFPGYGGYEYDGRWREPARRIARYFELSDNANILDVGCAKGFLLYDFKMISPAYQTHGVDVSEYAIRNSMPLVKDNLIRTSCTHLPYEDSSFDLVVSVDILQQLDEPDSRQAVREIRRVGRDRHFVSVHSYRNESERANLALWEPTIRCLLSVDEWKQLFRDESYQGHYWFTTFI